VRNLGSQELTHVEWSRGRYKHRSIDQTVVISIQSASIITRHELDDCFSFLLSHPIPSHLVSSWRIIKSERGCQHRCAGRRCLIIGSLPRKVSPGRQFIGKRPSARAGRIFTGRLSAGGNFSGRSYNGETFLLWGRQYFNKEKTYQIRDYLSPGGFFMGETF